MYSLFVSALESVLYAFSSLVFVVDPMRKDFWKSKYIRSPYILGALPWCFIFPTVLTVSGAPDDYLSGNVSFAYIKLWSVSIGCIAILFINYGLPIIKTIHEKNIRAGLTGFILSGNILEAAITQLIQTDANWVDYANGCCGIVLSTSTIVNVYINGVDVRKHDKTTELKSNLTDSYILAYTFWNVLFASKVLPELAFLMFLSISHGVCIVSHFVGYADWLQTRSVTLLFYMCLKFGITPEMRIFPEFFDPELNTVDNQLIGILHNDFYLFILLGLSVGCTLWNVCDTLHQSANYKC